LTMTATSEQEAETCLVPLFSRPWPQLLSLKLHLTGASFPVTPAGPICADYLFPRLVCLELCSSDIDWGAFNSMKFMRLRSLSVNENEVGEWRSLVTVMIEAFNALPQLRELKLDLTNVEDAAQSLKWLLVGEWAARLAVLRLTNMYFKVEDVHVIDTIAQRCKALRVLDIRCYNGDICRVALRMLLGCGAAGALPQLKEVWMPHVKEDGMWRALKKVWPGLERAEVYEYRVRPDGCSPGMVDYVYTD